MQIVWRKWWLGLTSLLVALTAVFSLWPSLSAPPPLPNLSEYPWFYLRDAQPLAADEPAIEIIIVGDVLLGRGVAGVENPLWQVAGWLQTADFAMGNLESTIVLDGTPRSAPPGEPQPIILNAPLTAVSTLHTAGFDLMSLANNHTFDDGPQGLAETAARLHAAGITTVGAGADPLDAVQPVFQELNGVKVAVLAFTAVVEPISSTQYSVNSEQWSVNSGLCQLPLASCHLPLVRATWDETAVSQAVVAARAEADVVIVLAHWGYEYHLWPDPSQEQMAHLLLAAGADAVIGHHPHVVQPVEVGDGKLVAYSLGNFVFDQGQGETNQGAALRLFVDGEGLRAAQLLPIWAGVQPRLMTPAEAEPLISRIEPPPLRLGFACDAADCQPTEVPQTAESGQFFGGAIDLTGDGAAEQIRRVAEQVIIYEAGTAVWQSPPAWQVVDVALGDPNDDGRFELMLAIIQPDPDGHPRSQPYMVGYRDGEYKLLWGGRPVVDPILELELGNVDDDPAQELILLEGRGDMMAVAVLNWAGWSYSLGWRSEYGRYQDLVLLLDGSGRFLITISSPN